MKQGAPERAASPLLAELILPISIPRRFTYRVPDRLYDTIEEGQCAIVSFGIKKITTGVVARLYRSTEQKPYEVKEILDLTNKSKVIYQQQFDLYTWIAGYYMCTLGEVVHTALPSGFLLSSKSMAQIAPFFDGRVDAPDFSDKEHMVLQRLANSTASYTDITKLLGIKNVYPILKSLSEKKAIILFEQVREKYKPKTEKRLRLAPSFAHAKALEKLFEKLKKKPKQEQIVLRYLQLVPILSQPKKNTYGVSRLALVKKKGISSLKTLLKDGVFEEFKHIVPRYASDSIQKEAPFQLSLQQQNVCDQITQSFQKTNTTLLHGITGSGKTEIYIDLIQKTLKTGRQALLLIPEIALTTQIVHRLKKSVGTKVGVYHSKFSDNERLETWNEVLSGKFRFVVGVRSSIFLPFDNLGLIIVDEEHDPSYKQNDPAPRYNARDVALIMGKNHRANVLLGSATPSIESYFQATQGKYSLVNLNERFGKTPLPEIIFADMRKEKSRKTNKGQFSSLLIKEIQQALQNKEQVLFFQNRRGYAPMAHCENCDWKPECINCSVNLTYHQSNNKMNCHYCGYTESLPQQCPMCESKHILTKGYGTERLEEELNLIFENTAIQRMDRDTTRTRIGYESIIADFEKSKTQILVGTQMITKGLDFDHVALVVIFDADRMRYFPDFRSYERAFQLILQAGGRAGRRRTRGKVVVQTTHPLHELFGYIARNDIKGFIASQLHDRRTHSYPPYMRLIEITVMHAYLKKCRATAEELVTQLKIDIRGIKILGPGEPMISKIRNQFRRTILIKIPRRTNRLETIKHQLQQTTDRLLTGIEHRSSKIVCDVDPVQ